MTIDIPEFHFGKLFKKMILNRFKQSEMYDLVVIWQQTLDALIIGGLCAYVLLTLTILIMMITFLCRGSLAKLPYFVQIALPGYLVYAMFITGIFTYGWTLDLEEKFSFFHNTVSGVLITIGCTLFLMLHWQFASYYLQSAMLFKVTISAPSDTINEQVSHKMKRVWVVQLSAYLSLIVICAVFCVFASASWWTLYFQPYWLLAEFSMTIVTLMAMTHIHKCTQQLTEIGIHKDAVLMKIYIWFWLSSTTFTLAVIGLNQGIHWNWNSLKDPERIKFLLRMNIALLVTTLLQFFNMVCLDAVILFHFYKAGDKARSKLAQELTQSIARARPHLALEISERQQAEKLHKHYQQMAEYQVQAIIESMLTLKNVDHSHQSLGQSERAESITDNIIHKIIQDTIQEHVSSQQVRIDDIRFSDAQNRRLYLENTIRPISRTMVLQDEGYTEKDIAINSEFTDSLVEDEFNHGDSLRTSNKRSSSF